MRFGSDPAITTPIVDTTITSVSSYYTLATQSDGYYYWDVRTRDAAGNWSPRSSIWQFQIDTVFVTVAEDIPEYGLTVPLILLPVIFIGIIFIRKRRK